LDAVPFRLGDWVVHPQDGTLRSGGASRRLEPQVMDLLVFLASRSGGVVSKQEILDHVWKGSLVSDDALTGAIYQLRKALGDDARRPRFIETIPKRGYRLLVAAGAPDAPAAESAGRRPAGWSLAAVLAVLALAGTAAWYVAARAPAAPEAASQDAGGVPAEALEAYQKGHSLLGQQTPQALQQARVYFQRALEIHPRFPAASAGLAESIVLRFDVGLGVPAELAAEARAAALQAIEADPDLAEAHSAYAAILAAFDWDFSRAEKELQRALQLQPDLAEAHRRYAYVASTLGRREEAIRAARRALALDPLSLPVYRDVAEMLIMARRYEEAVLEMRKALELDPDDPVSLSKMATAYWLQGKEREGYATYRRSLRAASLDSEVLARLDATFAREGMRGVTRAVALYLESQPVEVPSIYAEVAILYAAAGERDRAFAALGRACDERLPSLPWLAASPYLDSLRDDPRFAELLLRMRPPGPRATLPPGH
jgi:DNA-binding winged helix-turn-helix (wHTH) protein/Tfp pilus assembly protein PilF